VSVKEKQVSLYMSHRDQGKSQVKAALNADISERTGRRIEKGECDAKYTPRQVRTRDDPLGVCRT